MMAIKNNGSGPSLERIILGIDPGTTVMGFGIILVKGNDLSLVTAGAIRFQTGDDHTLKLRSIFDHVRSIIEEHRPAELAIEAQFFGKNVQSMLKLGRAQGVAIAAALHHAVTVVEYAPKRVKQSITGNGNATKEQVAAMLQHLLAGQEIPTSTDATDALAVAVCHALGNRSVATGHRKGTVRGSSDWGNFIRNNPHRVER